MENEFKSFLQRENLIEDGQKILLAVSGGLDSMVMLSLFKKADLNFGVAHCNYQLRGEESDEDERFVKSWCEDRDIQFFAKKFQTLEESKKLRKGIQETARDLRYSWFEEVCREHGYDLIATAHHKNDSIETMIFNLSRGAGISGLKGIDSKKGNVIRPMMFATRQEIRDYASEKKISFREDSSNDSLKYSRNKIRKTIIPQMQELNSSLIETMYKESRVFRESAGLIDKTLSLELSKHLIEEGLIEKLPLNYLKESTYPRLILWKWLGESGFTSAQMDEIINLTESQPGRKIFGEVFTVVKDREYLVLDKSEESDIETLVFDSLEQLSKSGLFEMEVKSKSDLSIDPKNENAYLDLQKIKFPLTYRRWKSGDRFIPFGSQKVQKVKDFLTHQKVPAHSKKEVKVLLADNDIIWVVGLRIDNRFSITSDSKEVLHLVAN